MYEHLANGMQTIWLWANSRIFRLTIAKTGALHCSLGCYL